MKHVIKWIQGDLELVTKDDLCFFALFVIAWVTAMIGILLVAT